MSIKRNTFTAILFTATLFASSLINSISAKEIEVYRWVDADGLVHFSQNLPLPGTYKELSTISSYNALSKEERKLLAQEKEDQDKLDAEADKQDKIAANNKKTFEKNCKSARLNIKMLNTMALIHISEEASDGSIVNRPLSESERKEKLALSKKHEEIYCNQ